MTEYFSNLKDILKGVEFRNTHSEYGEIISGWKELVGKKFADKCEVADFKQNGTKLFLYVNVFSSPLVQELGFFKRNLIQKINEKYNILFTDIIIKVATKQNKSDTLKQTSVLETYDKLPSIEQIRDIKIDENELEKIKQSIFKLNAYTETEKKRMFDIVVNDLKTQKWMKEQGFPVCKNCGRIITQKNFGDENLCEFCKNEQKNTEI